MAFSNILPDPVNKITEAGVYDNSTGTAGPGFASLNMRSVRDTQVSRTISGRGITRSQGSQNWEIDITYNPMTRDQFEPVYSFLLSRNARRSPFYVALPQYSSSRSGAWDTLANVESLFVKTAAAAGESSLVIRHYDLTGAPKPGDMFTITDVNDTNHTKAYRITRVETSTVYETAVTDSKEVRIHFVPPLVRAVAVGLTSISGLGTIATDLFTISSHGLSAGQEVKVVSGNTTDLVVDQIYYASNITSTTFKLATTYAAAIAGTPVVNLTVTTSTTFIPSPTKPVFVDPKIRCILKNDVQEYSLNTNNLYQFGLNLEEIQP